MSNADYHIGDSRETMRRWAAEGGIPTPWGPQQAHLILTSPPFLALRSYLPADDPNKVLEMGSEPTPAAFLDALLDWTAACADLLSPEGSLAVELGDTYSGSGGGGGDYLPGGLRENQPGFGGSRDRQREGNAAHWRLKNQQRHGWPLAKCKTLIPELYRVALAYGINPLTGQPSPAGQWRVRNVVTWARPNPSVGQLGDKYRPATSDLVIACRSANRWFDLDAVRTPTLDPPSVTRVGQASASKGISGGDSGNPDKERLTHNPAGAPPLDWWEISTEPYSGSHYATWPRRLCEVPVKSMCPTEVSVSTGEGRRRIVERERRHEADDSQRIKNTNGERPHPGRIDRPPEVGWEYDRTTFGWTDTDPNAKYRPGIVLDPFAGSGTTLAVATGHGRYGVGIDLDRRNADLATERVGPLLLTVHDKEVA